MTFTARELAEMCGGPIVGEAECEITGAASLAEATSGEITFYGNPRYLAAFRRTCASAAFVPEDFEEQIVGAQIRVADPSKAFEHDAIQSVTRASRPCVVLLARKQCPPHIIINTGETPVSR